MSKITRSLRLRDARDDPARVPRTPAGAVTTPSASSTCCVAMTEEPTARQHPGGVRRRPATSLRQSVTDVLERGFHAGAGLGHRSSPSRPSASTASIQQAVVHAAVSSAKQVDSGSLLVFMLQEEESHAAYFLKTQGVERLTLLRVISHGAPDARTAVPAGEPPAAAARPDPLEAYADRT